MAVQDDRELLEKTDDIPQNEAAYLKKVRTLVHEGQGRGFVKIGRAHV